MLQQTTVGAVLPYYEKWLKIFPDIRRLAGACRRRVLRAWQGLGYYQRARNLHSAAKIIVERYGGKFPNNFNQLRSLPGFGPYTTAAVLSLSFDRPYPVVDANVRRVLMRILAVEGEADGRHDRSFLELLNKRIPRKGAGEFNQALMELGALLCRPRNPQCLPCPARRHCRAYEMGAQEIIPKPKTTSSQEIEAVVGIILRNKKILIQKRPSTGLLAGLWEFPGGKIEPGETPRQALVREIKEEIGAEVSKADFLTAVEHCYTRYRVKLSAYRCFLRDEPVLETGRRRWVSLTDLASYPFPSGSVKIIEFLKTGRTD